MVVKARDDVNTPGVDEDEPNPFYYAYEPKENVIVGSSFKIRIIKRLISMAMSARVVSLRILNWNHSIHLISTIWKMLTP